MTAEPPSKYDIREDEQQAVKLQEIIQLLVAAGYFRARVKGLEPFDKVVGGMVWCIEMCAVDIDVDLLFHDSLNIGQKIALTEKIVRVLPLMKCPHPIEPHQIQGFDYIHIFPVVQWLVKKAIETREQSGDYTRAYAVAQFDQRYSLSENKPSAANRVNALERLEEAYAPVRLYRHQARHKLSTEEMQVRATLLEYGRGMAGRTASPEAKQEAGNKPETVAENEIMGEMQSAVAKDAGDEALVEQQAVELQQAIEKFQAHHGHGGEESAAMLQQREAAALQKEIRSKAAALAELEAKLGEQRAIYQEKKQEWGQVSSEYKQLTETLAAIHNSDAIEDRETFLNMCRLLALGEDLKKQESAFKQKCREELAALELKLAEERNRSASATVDEREDAEVTRVRTAHAQASEKMAAARLKLAQLNREIATLERKIDDVPLRTELAQYQRRFIELYEQVGATHKETKQFYTLYNTLDDMRMYLDKEIALLSSINDNYSNAMLSINGKEELLSQLEQIVHGVHQNRDKVSKRCQESKESRDKLRDTLVELVENQRLYVKTVHDFKEELRKNEILVGRLKNVGLQEATS